MKLSKLFVIALLAGTLGVIGCSDDPAPPAATGGTGGNGTGGTAGNGGMGGTAGNGGMGGTPAGNCNYGDCAEPGTERDACENAVDVCLATTPDGSELERVCVQGANTDACGPR